MLFRHERRHKAAHIETVLLHLLSDKRSTRLVLRNREGEVTSVKLAILNSLQMGFRTLALQKRSSEVWKVLGLVKKEFENFGGLLEKAQKNIQTGMSQLDEVVGTRTRAIQRQLRGVDSLPAAGSDQSILPDIAEEKVD